MTRPKNSKIISRRRKTRSNKDPIIIVPKVSGEKEAFGHAKSDLIACGMLSYPVYAQYMTTQEYAITKQAAVLLERMMLTYGNAPMVAKFLYECLGKEYINAQATYYSQAIVQASHNNLQHAAVTPLISFVDWIGSLKILPTGDNFFDLVDKAMESTATLSGISDGEHHTREIQAVMCRLIMVFDHTFQIVKNYPNEIGANSL